jgi:hypothetical protein
MSLLALLHQALITHRSVSIHEVSRLTAGPSRTTALAGDGVIPFRLRIGVTGHRSLTPTPGLVAAVDTAIDMVQGALDASACTPVLLAVVSSLGEGADRIVAERVLRRPGAILEVRLPLEPDNYESDFANDASREQFRRLLLSAKPEDVGVVPQANLRTREDAYERAGFEVFNRCDLLLALWDGGAAHGKGGTGEIARKAQRGGKPLIWIESSPPHATHVDWGDRVFVTAFKQLDAYNSPRDRGNNTRSEGSEAQRLDLIRHVGVSASTSHRLSDWIGPHLARADALADRRHRLFRIVTAALFFSTAAAVAAAATVALVVPHHHVFASVEIVFMLLVLLLFLPTGRRRKLEWVSYRFLAERFRAAPFLALADVRMGGDADRGRLKVDDPNQEWLSRSFSEVWRCRPRPADIPVSLEAARSAILSGWLAPQRRYYMRAAELNDRTHRRVLFTISALFATTVVAAGLHMAGVGVATDHESPLGTSLLLVAIVLPAAGAALTGFSAQHEFVRNAERFRHMSADLVSFSSQVELASEENALRRAVIAVDQYLSSENRDWIDVMRFHQLELDV